MRVDFAGMRNLYENVYMRQKEGKEDKTKLDISPLTAKMTKAELKGAGQGIAEIGLDAIRKGEVAVCTLAGGQGSRLGF